MNRKEAFQTAMEWTFQELSGRIEELKIRTEMAEERATAELETQREELRKKRKEMKKKLEAVKECTDEAWDSLKEELTAAALDLKNAVDMVASKFKQG
jgi:hypothetical protein